VAKNPILTAADQQPSPFDLSMSDDALVTFTGPAGPGALSFLDTGYMPVNVTGAKPRAKTNRIPIYITKRTKKAAYIQGGRVTDPL